MQDKSGSYTIDQFLVSEAHKFADTLRYDESEDVPRERYDLQNDIFAQPKPQPTLKNKLQKKLSEARISRGIKITK